MCLFASTCFCAVKDIWLEPTYSLDSLPDQFFFKVLLFWQCHKILRNLHLSFALCSAIRVSVHLDTNSKCHSKVRWRFCKILWPSQNIWALWKKSEKCIYCLLHFIKGYQKPNVQLTKTTSKHQFWSIAILVFGQTL